MWRVLPYTSGPAAAQLEQTEQLRLAVASGEAGATLRWYGYTQPALVLGVGQHQEVLDTSKVQAAGIDVVKRSSGGGVVFATPEMVALDVALPADSPLAIQDVVESYRWVGGAFMEALTRIMPGAPLALAQTVEARADRAAQSSAPAGTAEHQRGLACFGTLSPYELVLLSQDVPSRKLVGLSQVRKRGVVLHQVGFYARFSGRQMAEYLAVPNECREALGAELDRRIASLADVGLGGADVPRLMAEVNEAAERALKLALEG
jgi:lipoate-protein ligase A